MSLKADLDALHRDRYVTAYRLGTLTLYDYTTRTIFDGLWNEITLIARGLILDDAGRVVARPFPKFFNLGERPETQIHVLPKETPELAEKYDGSLLIVFRNPDSGRWQAVTRGSWDNVQTRYANAWLEERAELLDRACTYLFELVAPWNRIVLKYAEPRMILIGVIGTESGDDWSYDRVRGWGLDRGLDVVRFERRPLTEVDLNGGTGAEEGYVARYAGGLRVKLKYRQYLTLHKLLTGLTAKVIWESLAMKVPIDLALVPDEFLDWYREKKRAIEAAYAAVEARALALFRSLPAQPDRKSWAALFNALPEGDAKICFRLLDERPYDDIIWRMVRPVGDDETFQKNEE